MKPTPRLALSVTSKPSFIFKRIESLMQWGKDPFHPRRGQLAGVAVCLGIVAVMVALFGQPMQSKSLYQGYWKEAKDWRQIAQKMRYQFSSSVNRAYSTKHPDAILTYPMFYINGQLVWKYGETTLFGSMRYGSDAKISAFFLDRYGLFMFSLEPFANAQRVGKIEGKKLQAKIDGLDINIESSEDILIEPAFYGKAISLYVKHDTTYGFERFRAEVSEYQNDEHVYQSGYEANRTSEGRMEHWGMTDVAQVADLYSIEPKPNLAFKHPKIEHSNDSWMLEQMSLEDVCYAYKDEDQYIFYHSPTGVFVFSFSPFEDAQQTAVVEGTVMKVPTPKGEVTIESEIPILNSKNGKVWFKYEDLYQGNLPSSLISRWHRTTTSCDPN